MTLAEAKEGEEYLIKEIATDDEELEAFLLQRRTHHRGLPSPGRLRGFHQGRPV